MAQRIKTLYADLTTSVCRVKSFLSCERLFQINLEDSSELEEVMDELEPFHHLWEAYLEHKHSQEDCMAVALQTLVAAKIAESVDEQFKDSVQMTKSFEERGNRGQEVKDFCRDIGVTMKNT